MLTDCLSFPLVQQERSWRNMQFCHVYFQSPRRQRMRETDIQREEWQRQIDTWKESRAEGAVIEEIHAGKYVDAHAHLVSSRPDCMMKNITLCPILTLRQPVAMPVCVFLVPVRALAWKPEQLFYTDSSTAIAAYSQQSEVPPDHEVGRFTRKGFIL